MALFVLGDPHLSLGASKPMDIFPGWNDYVDRLEKNWRKLITPQDTIVLAGVSAQTTWEIIEQAPWVMQPGGPRLVLVPATRHSELRRWLW